MHFFLDTEFNGFGGELISLALVPADDSTSPWYEVKEHEMGNGAIIPWVKLNVIPVLNKTPLRPLLFKQSFQRYLTQFDKPTIICDWYSDAVHFCNMMNGPTHASSLSIEFTIKVIHHLGEDLQSDIPHNALADAIALKKWYIANNWKMDWHWQHQELQSDIASQD